MSKSLRPAMAHDEQIAVATYRMSARSVRAATRVVGYVPAWL